MNDFKVELGYINDERIRNNGIILLRLLPSYFYEIPASSTGKYHPSFALSNKGLVRHTKVAVRIAKELLDLDCYKKEFTPAERDLIILALLIHDGVKSGLPKGTYTAFDHPLLISKFVSDNKDKLIFKDDELNLLKNMLERHMGQWNQSQYSNIVLPTPETKYEVFVHMCDYLSSKKFLDVKFENNNIVDGG